MLTEDQKSLLRGARKLIEKPENWLKGILIKNVDGRHVDFPSHNAAAFCVGGALIQAQFLAGQKCNFFALYPQMAAVAGDLPKRYDFDDDWSRAVQFNNAEETTHEQLLAAIDRALAE